jgi:hypothetical protein
LPSVAWITPAKKSAPPLSAKEWSVVRLPEASILNAVALPIALPPKVVP